MKLSVIVATKDRYDDLSMFIKSLVKQSQLPNELIIVDASENVEMRSKFISYIKQIKKFEIKYIYTEIKGLTLQRNIGLKNISKDNNLVFFFDDDVILDSNYIKVICGIYEDDITKKIGGMNGFTLRDVNKNIGKIKGIKLKNGAYKYNKNDRLELTKIDILYGCNMNYRTEAIKNIWFDEKFKLYGWLEDSDFSYRVGKNFDLVRCNQAYLYHMASPKGRINYKKLGFMYIANIYYLRKKHNKLSNKDYLFFILKICKNTLYIFRKKNRELLKGNLIALFYVVILGKDLTEVENI